MGRKKISKETVVVDVDGQLMAWTDGYFSGDVKLLNRAKKHAANGDNGFPEIYPLTHAGPWVAPGNKSAINAAAALIALDPRRSRIVSAPDYVLEAIDDALGYDPEGENLGKPADLDEYFKVNL